MASFIKQKRVETSKSQTGRKRNPRVKPKPRMKKVIEERIVGERTSSQKPRASQSGRKRNPKKKTATTTTPRKPSRSSPKARKPNPKPRATVNPVPVKPATPKPSQKKKRPQSSRVSRGRSTNRFGQARFDPGR